MLANFGRKRIMPRCIDPGLWNAGHHLTDVTFGRNRHLCVLHNLPECHLKLPAPIHLPIHSEELIILMLARRLVRRTEAIILL